MRLSPEITIVVSLRRCQIRGPRQAAHTWSHRGCLVTPGSENMANDHEGPPGTWETLPSPLSKPAGAPAYQLQDDPVTSCPGSRGTKLGRKRWYRQAKATKCGEMDGRESERLIVALTQGHGPSRTLPSEGDAASRPAGRHHAGDIEPRSVYPEGRRIVRGTARDVTSRMR